jgi:hypothetical protein
MPLNLHLLPLFAALLGIAASRGPPTLLALATEVIE